MSDAAWLCTTCSLAHYLAGSLALAWRCALPGAAHYLAWLCTTCSLALAHYRQPVRQALALQPGSRWRTSWPGAAHYLAAWQSEHYLQALAHYRQPEHYLQPGAGLVGLALQPGAGAVLPDEKETDDSENPF